MLVRKWRNWISHSLLVGKYDGTTALEKSLFLIKLNTQVLHDPVIVLLAIVSEKWKLTSTKKKNLVYPSFFSNSPKLEIAWQVNI